MAIITETERDKLYLRIKHLLGYPIRPFELKDAMLNTYLDISIENYSSYLNEWLIQQQWINLQGLDNENSDILAGLTTKSNDYIKSFQYAYSKQVGLGTNAPAERGWELKRDYIVTSAHTQHYIVPANREINEVLWETPSGINHGMVDPFALSNWSSGQFGWSYLGKPAMYVQPTYSLLLAAQDRRTKERILQSDLSYRVTGLETGEKILYLYPIPGSRNEIRDHWGKHYSGRKVWYFYYDTKNGKREDCVNQNSDIIRLPSDPPVEVMRWDKLNSVAKQQVRDLFLAEVKIALGGIRGFYSGNVGSASKQLELDYRHLLDEGETLRKETKDKILEMLNKLSQVNITEERARIAQNINEHLKYQPFRTPIITK